MNVPGQSAIRKITPVLVSAALMGFCGAALANNKMQTIEFDGGIPSSDPVWVECLGEYVYGPFHVTAKTHAFETPSGTFHFVENWDLTQELTGASTGRVWLIKSVSPATDNAAPATVAVDHRLARTINAHFVNEALEQSRVSFFA